MANALLRPFLHPLLRVLGRTPDARRPSRPARSRRLTVEALEERLVMDATLQVITVPTVPPPSVSAAAGTSNNASVSADGRYVAYESTATNLVAGQAGPITSNVFLFDRQTNATTLVSHDAASGAQVGNADSFSAVLSGNGRYLYYLSLATDLVASGSGPATANLYVYDTVAKTTRLVTSHAGNPNQRADGTTGLLNPSLSTGAPFAVSADGTRVAYVSAADDVVSGLSGQLGAGHPNVFLADVSNPATVTTQLVSHQATSTTAGAGGWSPALSADGSAVAFVSDATNLAAGQVEQTPSGTAPYTAVFEYSTASTSNILVSRKAGTTATVAGAASDTPAVDADGGVVAFRSDAPDLVAQQFAGSPSGNVFVYERALGAVGLVSHAPGQPTVGTGGTPLTPDSSGPLPLSISADGRSVAYQSQAAGLVAGAPAAGTASNNVFLWQLSSASATLVDGTNYLVSGAGGSPTTPANGSSSAPVLSSDGSTVAFESAATNLVPGQASSGGARNVFTASAAAVTAAAGTPPTLVSSATGSTRVAGNADSAGGARGQSTNFALYPGSAGLSADGGTLIFQSAATNLSTDIYKANNGTDVFAYDAADGVTLVSQGATAVVTAGGDSYLSSVSNDDRYTAFVSDAFDLVAGQQNNHFGLNVFLRDDNAGTVTLVNHVPTSASATGDSGLPMPPFTPDPVSGRLVPPPPAHALMPVVSGDGSTVVFVSNDHDLVPGQQSPGSYNNVFRYAVADGSITLVSHLPYQLTVSGAYDSNSPVVSASGEFIAFVSNGGVYLDDANAPQTLTQIAASASSPSMSDDGRYVAYVSAGNAFLYDRLAGTSALVSHDPSSARAELLALSAPPAAVTAGQAFALTATVQDAFGITDTAYSGTVTLALAPGSPAGATLGGGATATAVNGVAHFTNVTLTLAGSGYALTASAPGVTAALSPAFQVVPGPAAQLGFLPPPALSLVKSPLSPTAAVAVEDAYGNLTRSSVSVTVALGSNPTGATLAGTKTAAAVNGVATFPGLSLDRPGTYTLTASASGFKVITSPAFAVTATPAALKLSTVAGTGTEGFTGDGGPATAAELAFPQAVAVDAQGNLYIADNSNNRVRKVTPAGIITTVAGNGTYGFAGDGGPATAAELFGPQGVALDARGDLFIADQLNNRVREVTPDGIIHTLAGTSSSGFSGDGGPATAAQLFEPNAVATDAAGDVFIADMGNDRVRKVTPAGIITTFAGSGTSGYGGDGGPATAAELQAAFGGLATDAVGNLYIADTYNYRIRQVTPAGTITTFAGDGTSNSGGDGGPATAAELEYPTAVAADAAGNVYIVDFGTVREVSGGIINTVAGGGTASGDGIPATAASLSAMDGVAADATGALYLLAGQNVVRKATPTVTILALTTPPPFSVTAGAPFTVAVTVEDAAGNAVPGYSGPVTVTLGPDSPAGTALGGATTVYAVNGVATFSLTLTQATGSAYSLRFDAANVTDALSSSFVVDPGPASSLLFSQQPVNAVAGQVLNPAVAVEVLDAYGNQVGFPSPDVTLALAPNPAGAVLGGTTTQPSYGGTATFADLTVPRVGSYRLVASAGTLPPATSAPFSVTATAAVLTINTVVGIGTPGFSGEGGPATAAEFANPGAVAIDAAGNVYIADQNNNRVRKVAADGSVSTVAGTGTFGYAGDGGPAAAAELADPTGVAVDAAGNVYIADGFNGRVRKVTPAGVITTVAGGGTSSPGDGGPATAAQLSSPQAVAVDAQGDLFIADGTRVREVTPDGTITTVAGTGSYGFGGDGGPATAAQLAGAAGVAVDGQGNVFIADQSNQRVREVAKGVIRTVAGTGSSGDAGDGGAATLAQLSSPAGVAVDGKGNLYIADQGNSAVRLVTPAGTIRTFAGTGTSGFGGDGGPASAAQLDGPAGVAADAAGDIFIGDAGNNRVREVTSAGTIRTFAGNGTYGFGGDVGPATAAELAYPDGVAVDAAGNLYVADTGNDRVREILPSGRILTVAGTGVRGFSGDGGPATAAQLDGPEAVVVDARGNLYISDQNNNRVRKVAPDGTITTYAGSDSYAPGDGGPATAAHLSFPAGLALDAAGDLFIADQYAFSVREVLTNGTIVTVAGNGTPGFAGDGGPATAAQLFEPSGVAVDGQGNLYVSDTDNQRVREVTNGIITTVAGTGTAGFAGDGGPATAAQLGYPAGLAVDAAGNLYVADSFNDRVRQVTPAGIISTYAGGGTANPGDGGPADAASLSRPAGLALDAAGNLLIADRDNNRIRKVANPAAALAFVTAPPATVPAATPFTVAVSVVDAGGTVVSGASIPVTLALGAGSPAGAALQGTTTVLVNPANGVATFSGLQLPQQGTGYTLVARAAGLTAATTSTFKVGGVTASVLTATPPAGPVTAGTPFTFQVAAQDLFGNTDPTYTGPVTVALGPGSPAGATLGGTLTVNARAGVATFSNLTVSQPGKGFSLTATAANLQGVTTAPFAVGAAAATRLVVAQPAGVKAGVPFAFTVTATDSAGNVATGFNGPVTVNLGQNPVGAALGGNTTLNAVNGVARFALSVTPSGSGYTLTASAAGLTAATSPFAAAPTPELLVISPPPAVTAGTPFGITVSAEDAHGNPDPAFAGKVTLAVGPGSPAGAFLDGTTAVTAAHGIATFSGLQLTQAGSYTLTATTAGLTGGFSSAFTVSAGAAAQLALTPPARATAGAPFAVTVAVQDAVGNPVPSFNGPVTVTLGGGTAGATLGGTGTVNAVKGVAAFSLSVDRAGAGYTLTATAAGLPAATSLPFAVGGVTATQLGVTPPAYAVAGVPFAVTVSAQDAGGNVVPSFNGLVTLALGAASPAGSSLGGTLTAQAVNGVATFTGLTLATPGTGYALAAAAGTLSGTAARPLAVLAGGDAPSSTPVVSASGNYVAYVSLADNLVAGQQHTGFTNVLLYNVPAAGNALVSGSTAKPADGNSDSPAIDVDGSYVAYRSDADNLAGFQYGPGGNIYLYSLAGGSTTLVSGVAASPGLAAGGSFAPVIDGDGSKVVYLSSGGGLVSGETASTTTSAYLYSRPLAGNFLLTGQFGSATTPANGNATNALIGRHSIPHVSSYATNLVQGVGAHSNGYRTVRIATQISTALTLANNVLPGGTGPGVLVGTFSTTDPYAGQFLPPRYSLSGVGASDGLFQIPGGNVRLLTGPGTTVGAPGSTYTIQVVTDIGLAPLYGIDTITITVGAGGGTTSQPPPPPPPPPSQPAPVPPRASSFTAHLAPVKLGKRSKTARLMALVAFASGRTEQITSPFQAPAYRAVQVTTKDTNGDGVPDALVFTAVKGKRKVTATITV